eukprot:s1995_g20.t1
MARRNALAVKKRLTVTDEHSDVHDKLQRLADLVNKALEQLRSKVDVSDVQWRRRGRNKTADRLSHEARQQRSTDAAVRIAPAERRLLNGYETEIAQTAWDIVEAHPLINMSSDFVVEHPQQHRCSGFMGLKFAPQSADGSFSLVVRMEGTWNIEDSFLLGLMAPDSHCLNESHGFDACDVGYWFSPKSGRVFGPGQTNFILPSLRDAEDPRWRSIGYHGFRTGACWGITYQQGSLAIYHAVDDLPMELLEVVTWPSDDFIPQQRYSAVLLFKPRSGSRAGLLKPARCAPAPSLAKQSGKGGGKQSAGRRRSPPSLRLLGSFRSSGLSNQSMVNLAQAKAFLVRLAQEFAKGMRLQLENATILQAKLLLQMALARSGGTQHCQVVSQMPWISKYLLQRGGVTREAIDAFFSAIGRQSPHVGLQIGTLLCIAMRSSRVQRIQGSSVFRHPQPARAFEYIAFEAGRGAVGVKMGGKWTKQDRVLIGFVDQETDLDKVKELHPADLGYFFSIRSRSIVSCDGTNFEWGTLVQAWAKQLEEQGCLWASNWLARGLDCDEDDVFGESPAICVKLSKDLEFDVFVRCQSIDWIKLGRVWWRGGPTLPRAGKAWCPTIIFMPRRRMGQPRCAVPRPWLSPPRRPIFRREECGRRGLASPKVRVEGAIKKVTLIDRFANPPRLQVLDLTSDRFCDMPTFDSGSGKIVWENPPQGLCKSLLIDLDWTRFEHQSLVEHNSFFEEALQTHERWKRHVTASATKLEDELNKRTNRLDQPCAACDNKAMTMTGGPIDHLTSRSHWIELWKKVKDNMPSRRVGAQMDLKLPWVQSWEIPGGALIFNHLTAALRLELSEEGLPSAAEPTHFNDRDAQEPTEPTQSTGTSGADWLQLTHESRDRPSIRDQREPGIRVDSWDPSQRHWA